MGNKVPVLGELPFHLSSTYNGKILEPLCAVNGEGLRMIDCGVWSEQVPQQLSLIIQRPDKYREAMGIINTVSQTKVRFRSYWPLFLIAFVFSLIFLVAWIPFLIDTFWTPTQHTEFIATITSVIVLLTLLYYLSLVAGFKRRITLELQKAISQANSLLYEEKVLMGAQSNSKLLLVYVSVDSCRLELSVVSQNCGLFQKAILDYSADYISCLARRHFPFKPVSNTGHLEGTMCFCQFVFRRLSMERFCFCCRKQYSYARLED